MDDARCLRAGRPRRPAAGEARRSASTHPSVGLLERPGSGPGKKQKPASAYPASDPRFYGPASGTATTASRHCRKARSRRDLTLTAVTAVGDRHAGAGTQRHRGHVGPERRRVSRTSRPRSARATRHVERAPGAERRAAAAPTTTKDRRCRAWTLVDLERAQPRRLATPHGTAAPAAPWCRLAANLPGLVTQPGGLAGSGHANDTILLGETARAGCSRG